MAKYYCSYCKYKFESKKEIAPPICPFCSKGRTLVRDMGAEALIREIDEME